MPTVTNVHTRKPFDMPTTLAKLLLAAGVEQRAPEEVAGLLFGSLAHLSVGLATQFPEQWAIFRGGLITSCDDLRDILTSDTPAAVLVGVMNRQHRDSGGKFMAGRAVDGAGGAATRAAQEE